MYPNIPPSLKVKSTISDPTNPEKVIGFVARNTRLGREAVVIKEENIDSEKVAVPIKAAQTLTAGDGELVVLGDETVKTMDGADFSTDFSVLEVEGRRQSVEMACVDIDNQHFWTWKRVEVEVRN